jgi:low affinity Fe/Cu permease
VLLICDATSSQLQIWKETHVSGMFRRIAERSAALMGSSWSFLVAVLVIMLWAVSGPVFGFSNTWQLVINTGTTIITFLMVFLIQNTQNRDSKAIHLKLDELLKGVKGARTSLVDLEDMSDDELRSLQQEFEAMHHRLSEEVGERSEEVSAEAGARAGAEVGERVAQETVDQRVQQVAEDTVRETVSRR